MINKRQSSLSRNEQSSREINNDHGSFCKGRGMDECLGERMPGLALESPQRFTEKVAGEMRPLKEGRVC